MQEQLVSADALLQQQFRYDGPRPQRRESGIIMLADSVEAAARCLDKPSAGRIQSLVESIVREYADIDEFQIVLTREGRMDEMEILIEAAPAATDADAAAAAAELARHVKNLVGISARVSLAAPGGVERSQGKARRVIDKRPKG